MIRFSNLFNTTFKSLFRKIMFYLYAMINVEELFVSFSKILKLLSKKIILCLYNIMISKKELKVI